MVSRSLLIGGGSLAAKPRLRRSREEGGHAVIQPSFAGQSDPTVSAQGTQHEGTAMSDEVHGRREFPGRMALEIAGVGVGIPPAEPTLSARPAADWT